MTTPRPEQSSGASPPGGIVPLRLTSSAFTAGTPIPQRYTCQGNDVSPPLAWSQVPPGTNSLCLICDDPDAPAGTWVHWVIFNIPPTVTALPEDVPPREATLHGALQGMNDFGRIGFGGPCPPPGKPHRYYFRLSALDTILPLAAGIPRSALDASIKGHLLGAGELMGTYQRK